MPTSCGPNNLQTFPFYLFLIQSIDEKLIFSHLLADVPTRPKAGKRTRPGKSGGLFLDTHRHFSPPRHHRQDICRRLRQVSAEKNNLENKRFGLAPYAFVDFPFLGNVIFEHVNKQNIICIYIYIYICENVPPRSAFEITSISNPGSGLYHLSFYWHAPRVRSLSVARTRGDLGT